MSISKNITCRLKLFKIFLAIISRFLDIQAMTEQFNFEIPAGLARAARMDIADLGVTKNDYGRMALESFLSMGKRTRHQYFNGSKKKTVGRKVKV